MDISKLKPGDKHYMAYVGRPTQYDFMGASQFRLLCTLGLRQNHKLLDFGCGSLRAGRLFISYLNNGCYYGIEPNKWLIDEAISNQVGKDLIRIKRPQFAHNPNFATNVFHEEFDFIIAQSIFSHAGIDIIDTALKKFKETLKNNGLIAATFVEGVIDFEGSGWVYPDCVRFKTATIKRIIKDSGLYSVSIPWYHPSQKWYILAKDSSCLPKKNMMPYLIGAVLFDPEFDQSLKQKIKFVKSISKPARNIAKHLPVPLKNRLKRLIIKKST